MDQNLVEIPSGHQCEHCSKIFSFKSSLTKHKKIHTGQKDHKCTLCPYLTNSKSDLTTHIRSHTKEQPFNCPEPNCNSTFSCQSNLQHHRKIHTGEKDFKCTFCVYSANAKDSLDRHIRTHTKEKPFKCPHQNCASTFGSQTALTVHGLVHNKNDESVLKYQCQVSGCIFKTGRLDSLKSHMTSHSQGRPFVCELCPYRAKAKTTLNRHYTNVHSTEKPFKCPQANCSYTCKNKDKLSQHMVSHSDERSFACSFPECTFTGKTKKSLKYHERFHSGEKPFKCSFCELSFARNSSLTIHIRVHTGERPHPCQSCPYRAKSSSNLVYHVKRKHGGQQCT